MQEWYLLNSTTRPNELGGYENQSFLDWKDDSFAEVLLTDMASDIVVYSHDMSIAKNIRAIVQGNVADTSLQAMQRRVLVPIGTLSGGDYIGFDDNIWIVDGRPGDNHIYEKATLKLCQYQLKWQKPDGTIIERWANFESASKYDVGQNTERYMTLPTNDMTVLIPYDEDGFTIENKRVFIDPKPDDTMKKVFKITRADDVLFKYDSKGGVISLLADRHEFNPDTDRADLELCDYIEIQDPSPIPDMRKIFAEISGKTTLKVGYTGKYSVVFKNKDGNLLNPAEIDFAWSVSGEIADSIELNVSEADNTQAMVYTSNESIIEDSFDIQVLVGGEVNSYLTVAVIDLY